MKKPCIVYIMLMVILLSTNSILYADYVKTKIICEIQPSFWELGDYFSDAANQAMIDSGYTFLMPSIEGQSVGDPDASMENISAWLEDTYGILEYGGHGNYLGETGGETFATRAEAETKKQWLTDWQYFTADQLSIGQNGTYYMLCMTRGYTNSAPVGCDIAFISTCHGDVAGNFKAKCLVFGMGEANPLALAASFSCMMAVITNENYKTIPLACTFCQNSMNNPAFAFGNVCTDWQLFKFNSAAEIFGFSVIDGFARWHLEDRYLTDKIIVEGSPDLEGPWDEILAQDTPLLGPNEFDGSIQGHDYKYFRLVELEKTGKRLIHGMSKSQRSDNGIAINQANEIRSRLDGNELKALVETLKSKRISKPRFGARTAGEPSSIVIYTRDSLLDATESSIAEFWTESGCNVSCSSVDGFTQNTEGFRAALKASIADNVASGADFILLVGDANDYREFSQPWPDDWESIRQDRIAVGYPESGQPKFDIIATFTVPDELPRDIGMSYYSPYYFTDQPYGDVDDDGIIDVVIGRLPFDTEAEIYAYGTKLWSDPSWNADNIAFLVGDRAQGEDGAEVRARNGAARLMQEIPPWTAINTLYWLQTYQAHPEYNAVAANFINTHEPDLLVMFSSLSNRSCPGDFMDKTMMSPYEWTMNRITTPNTFFIIGAACGTADFARTENPAHGLPVAHEFLAEPGKGAIAWMGPTAGSWQEGNEIITKCIIEELYRYPYRPAGEAFLRAIRRVLTEYSNNDDITNTARSYAFLGDPLVPFSSVPSNSISSYVRFDVGEDLVPMPDNAAVGCPQGDEDEILIKVVIAGDELPMPVQSQDIAIEGPTSGNVRIFSPQASSMIQLPNGDYEATISMRSFGGCGKDSVLVTLYGMGIGYAQLNVKSPDADALGTSDGKVSLIDFSNFGQHYRSSICDCYYAYPYSWCVDYIPPADTTVDLQDFSFFGGHYNHHSSTWPPSQVDGKYLYSEGTVALNLVESDPFSGPRKVFAHVTVANVEPYRIIVLSFKNTNTDLSYAAWHQDPELSCRTICAPINRDGQTEVFLVVLGEASDRNSIHLGYFELNVNIDDAIVLTDDDFALVTADLLESGGAMRVFQGVANPRESMGFHRTYTPATYANMLGQNYPNPFNPETTIRFSLEHSVHTVLKVYDVNGSLIRTLISEQCDEGNHRIRWDGRNNDGQPAASGVYFYKLKAGDYIESRKAVLLR